MATCQTPRWVSTAPYIKLTVTESDSTATKATLSWKLQYISDSAARTSVAKSYTVKINGSSVKTGTYDINGKDGTYTIASGTKSITKTTSAQKISFSCSMDFNLTWSGTYGGTKSGSGSITVAKKTSYAVSYNTNGGSNPPEGQTKWHGTDLKLSSVKPTRTGYTFKGWGTSSSDTSVDYAAGATYTSNAKITLYAIWDANKYTVTFNANGGSGGPTSQTKTYGKTLTLSSSEPTKTGYTFKGWGTSASDTSVDYNPGGSYTANKAITLYAIWKINTYSVKFNANGGSGEPATQTKTYGKTLTLSSTKPTKTGYTFKGWGTSSSDTSVDYAAGGSYTANEGDTLYAVWEANKYTITFNANGGSGGPSTATKTYGVTLKLPTNKPTRTNYNFKGWGTSKTTKTVSYAAGANYTSNAKITLYAVWELAYKAPRITGVSIDRCISDEDKTSDDLGTSANLIFNWACDKTVASITIKWKLSTATSYPSGNSKTISASNTSGKVDVAFGANALNTEYAYDVRIVVKDELGSTTVVHTLSGAKYLIDLLKSGDGIAFGKPASRVGYADFGFKVNFSDEAFANGCRLATNKVLWSGAWYMNADHTASLSESISSQANGIVLVFSHYDNGEAKDYGWNCHYIPKYMVSTWGGKGYCFSMMYSKFEFPASKYLYISNTTITGNADNNASGTANGVTYNNTKYVLRYVIGV